MNLTSLKELVAANADWFRGVHPETERSLADAERSLGVVLPETLKWLLSEHGYSSACGVPNLGESIELTLRCRRSIDLPACYVILEDKGDAGVVLLDTASSEGRVLWMDSAEVSGLGSGKMPENCDRFADFTAWVSRSLEDAKDWASA
jgi:hypothetical protein